MSTKPTELPGKYSRRFPWELDRRCAAVREIAADLVELWTSLGTVESLSPQRLWLIERVVFIRRRMIAFETAVLAGTELPFDYGSYSNLANVCQGHLRTLGLDRVAKPTMGLREYLASKSEAAA
ncbi:MAG TPA: hypothetical protein VK437_14965 [Steroidobacteraceae bacterium]|nr:hypothetical protein [Steroidobacteraceae bacterium]